MPQGPHGPRGRNADTKEMALRSCLFTRQVFNSDGEIVGTIRVEFIPNLKLATKRTRVPLRQAVPRTGSKAKEELECNEELSDTVEFTDESDDEF